MRELSREEIDQVSAGTTPFAPIVAIPTIHHAAASNLFPPVSLAPDVPFPLPPLAEGKLA